eukprot:4034020-Lingulodinium_polyedra.AAC.1
MAALAQRNNTVAAPTAPAQNNNTLGNNTVAALTAGTLPRIFEKCSLALRNCFLQPALLLLHVTAHG